MISSTAAPPISEASTRWASVARERFGGDDGFGSDIGRALLGKSLRKPARANGRLRRGGRDGGPDLGRRGRRRGRASSTLLHYAATGVKALFFVRVFYQTVHSFPTRRSPD